MKTSLPLPPKIFSFLHNVQLWKEFYISMNITNFSLHIVISNFTYTHKTLQSLNKKSKRNHEVVTLLQTIILFMEEMMRLFQLLQNWEKYSKGQLYYKMVSDSASLACQHSTTFCQIYHSINTLFANTVANTKIATQIPVNKWDQNRRKLHILKVFCKNAHGHLLSNNKWVKKRW